MARIDASLATDGGVDLRQKRGRQLHEADAALHERSGKARQIADDAAAKCYDRVLALDP